MLSTTEQATASTADAVIEHHSHTKVHHHYHQVGFYTVPRQRQRWGDHQAHPHTNWGDIFFDLFYVAAAYNLGNVLREDPTLTGLLYVAGLFLPIQNLWTAKTVYDARFYYENDYFHRLYEIALLLALASAVLYIRPVAFLSDPQHSVDMFAFCLSILLSYGLVLGRSIEIMVCQKLLSTEQQDVGLFPESFASALRDALYTVCGTLFIASATIYSGVQFYANQENSTAMEESEALSTSDYAERWLATVSDDARQNDNTAIWLLLASTMASLLYSMLRHIWFQCVPGADHKQITVPVNVNYAIHRYGEWIMLMLGETVLSLLIVDIVNSGSYFITFLCGIISIVLLEYLHFQSQPSEADDHAYRRSTTSGIAYFWFMQVYSLALIILGASYKMLLFENVYAETTPYDDGSSEQRRHLLLGHSAIATRWLAGGESAALRFTTDDRQQRIAHLFAGSLTVVFVARDMIGLAHRGIEANWKRYAAVGCHKKKKATILLVLFRFAVPLFTASVSQYLQEPYVLAIVGLVVVLCQLVLHILTSTIFDHPNAEEADDEATTERVIRYNTARMHELPEHTAKLEAGDGDEDEC